MDLTKIEMIEKLSLSNHELGTLWNEHLAFERQLEELNSRIYLSPQEQIERKRIQKLKLAGRDRIEAILAQADVSA